MNPSQFYTTQAYHPANAEYQTKNLTSRSCSQIWSFLTLSIGAAFSRLNASRDIPQKERVIELLKFYVHQNPNSTLGENDAKAVFYVADQIFSKSIERIPNSQLDTIFSPQQDKEKTLFAKYRYAIALTLAIKVLGDERYAFSRTFKHICNDTEIKDEKSQNNMLEVKFLESTGFWFPSSDSCELAPSEASSTHIDIECNEL